VEAAISEEDVVTLAALDPANPYGALLPWPEPTNPEATRPRRVAGAWVLLAQGRPVLYVGPRGRQLITFTPKTRDDRGELDAAFRALHHLPRGTRRSYLVIEKIDGVPALESPCMEQMRSCGFERDYHGLASVRDRGGATGR
jgi:ATP-dependent Lhr-like helicase